MLTILLSVPIACIGIVNVTVAITRLAALWTTMH